MSQAIADPAELRRFATTVKRFTGELQTNLNAVHGQLLALAESWRDQEHDRFREEFELKMKELERFIEICGEYTPFLLRKAERIEEYMQQR